MSDSHPVLVIMRGIPGSGKSFLASKIVESIGDDKVTLLDPDAIDKDGDAFRSFSATLSADGVDEKFHPFRFLRQQGFDAILNNQIIIWNQAFIDLNGFQITVNRLMDFAKEHSIDLPLLVIEVEIDPAIAKSRIGDRVATGGHDVPEEKFDQFASEYESFAKHGYETVTVNGADNIDISLHKILNLDGLIQN